MQIDLPQDILERVQRRAATGRGESDAEVIRKALDSLDRQDATCAAIQEGIDAWKSGNYLELDDFDQQFRQRNGIPLGGE
jgi:Arc/MetJ-type ribon-helix-helix transcriptional regulator